MSVRKRKWRDRKGHQHERWMCHIEHTWPDGRKQTIRKVSPVQTKRGAEKYERELRKRLASGEWEEESKSQEPNRNTGKPLAARTVNAHLKILSRMLRVARRWKLIREQPEFEHLKVRDTNFDFLDFDEAEDLIAATAEHQPQWLTFVVVGLRTGLRVGELMALRWREDVDLERGRIRVQQSLNKKGKFVSTKNDEIREVPLSWDTREQLERHLAASTTELVFPGKDGGPSDRKASLDALKRVTKAVGMRHVYNHMMRHSFASHAVMRGIPIRQVQEWLGHKSITQTMRYAHLASGHGDGAPARTRVDSPRP